MTENRSSGMIAAELHEGAKQAARISLGYAIVLAPLMRRFRLIRAVRTRLVSTSGHRTAREREAVVLSGSVLGA